MIVRLVSKSDICENTSYRFSIHSMRIQPFDPYELRFAYAYHVYFRWQTWRGRPIERLAKFDRLALQQMADEFNIQILETESSATDLVSLLSLRPSDSASVVASKLKARLSKWLGNRSLGDTPAHSLKHGYFACTSGKSTATQVEQYLETQGTHHGYEYHARQPVYVQQWPPTDESTESLAAYHASTHLHFHIVLATTNRNGIFTAEAGKSVAAHWRETERDSKFLLHKISFLPDHVHLAVKVHPSVVPAELILKLMNTSQELMFHKFSNLVIQAKVERLWHPCAYLGSYGDLASPMIQKYIRRWGDAHE